MKFLINLFFYVPIFLFISITGLAQNKKVSNIFFRAIDDKIEIFYDLPKNIDTLNVTIFFRKKSHPKTKYPLRNATGSIGIGRFSGKKQKVIWSYRKEPAYLFTGSGFYYEIVAKKISPTQNN